jgi:ABC-type phosphate transport system substrate-binding protein
LRFFFDMAMRRRAAPLLALVLLLVATSARPAGVAIAVIVHPSRDQPLPLDDVARIFLKKQRFWDDGAAIVPLNREAGSAIREAFSRRVFGKSSAALAAYWNDQYFLGTFPPVTLSSTEAVKRYVASDPNAIGYVEGGSADSTVRVALELS